MKKKQQKNNEPSPALFSGEFREVVRRVKGKEPELDDLLNREQEGREPKEKGGKAKIRPAPAPLFAGRSGPLVRQWAIIRHLSQHPSGCQVQELCRILQARSRTIYRDLIALKRAGFPLMNHKRKDHSAFWTIGPWWKDEFREEPGESPEKNVKKTSKVPRRAH